MGQSAERCGYEYDLSGVPDVTSSPCERPVWDDRGRCVWHADDGVKDRGALTADAPSPGDVILGAHVADVSLRGVDWFQECTLVGSTFENVDLRDASFEGADLRNATVRRSDLRQADFTGMNAEGADVDDTDLRGARLVDVRLNQAVFSDVRIDRTTEFGDRAVYEQEFDYGDGDDTDRYREAAQAAIWTYRRMQQLYEENGLAVEERRAYVREKNVQRRLAWRTSEYVQAVTSEVSRWMTGYGMSPWRVLGSSFALILICALLYPVTGGIQETVDGAAITWEVENPGGAVGNATDGATNGTGTPADGGAPSAGEPLHYYLATVLFKSLYFSVITFSTLGYGDIQPVGTGARTIAATESFLGSLLMALLVFVLTRRIT